MLKINGVNYRYRSDDDSAPLRVGVIAQDVKEVLPEAVGEDKGVLNVRYPELVPLVIEGVKELNQKVVERGQELEAVKAENAQLKAYLCDKDPDAHFCK